MTNALITAPTLRLFASRCDWMVLAPALATSALANDITTPVRVCAWLGQLYVESAGLTAFEENLNYTAAELRKEWPKRFAVAKVAEDAAHKPQAIAEWVYGGRMGNDAVGDGWLYRGRGLIQITGKDEYAEASHWTGIDLLTTPALAADPKNAAAIAGAYWKAKGCNALADKGDVGSVTHAINNGLTALAERKHQTHRATMIWR